MPQFDDDWPGNLRSTELFPKLASGVPGVLFIYERSADGQHHRYPFVSERVRELFGIEPADLQRDGERVFSVIRASIK